MLQGIDDTLGLFFDGHPALLNGPQVFGEVSNRTFDAQVVQLTKDDAAVVVTCVAVKEINVIMEEIP